MIHLEITTKIGCSVNCPYCPQDKLLKAYKSNIRELSLNNFRKCLNHIPKRVPIIFSGFSEPFLNKDCSKMILYAYENGRNVGICTTGVGIRSSDIEMIKHIPFAHFIIHLIDREDDEYLNMIEVIIKNRINNLSFLRIKPLNINLRLKELLEKYNIEYAKHTARTRAGNVNGLNKPDMLTGKITDCKRIMRGVLLPNCDIVLCCMDFGLKHILGNLLKEDYDLIYKGKEFKRILRGRKGEKESILCRGCEDGVKDVNMDYTPSKIYNKHLLMHYTNVLCSIIYGKYIKMKYTK